MPRGSHRRPSHPAFAPPVPPPRGLARRVLPWGTVVWSVPHLLSAASPPCCFVLGRGGRCPPLPSFILHPWGGGGVCVGGGGACRFPFVARMSQARRKQGAGARRGTRPSAGWGGHALRLPLSPFLPCARTPGGSPCRGLHGACPRRARSCGPSRTLLPLPPYPAAVSSGRGRFSPPPLPASPALGGAGVGGGGRAPMLSPLRCTHVAGTTQAQHKHGVGHLAAAGQGVSPLGLPALLHGIGSAPQDHQPLLPLGGSRHVSAWC